MRVVVSGVDDAGRSCLVRTADIGSPGDPASNLLFATEQTPPPARPAGRGEDRDAGIAPGLTRWVVTHWAPGEERSNHHTDTIDYGTVLQGSIELLLDDGAHLLTAGDCSVVPGVDHGWRAGPDGCTITFVVLGSTRP